MLIRESNINDFDAVWPIYQASKQFMLDHNNPNQWNDIYPNEDDIKENLEDDGYVVLDDEDKIVGAFVFNQNADEEAYQTIHDGSWINDKPYSVIHALATFGGRNGVGQFVLDWCWEKSKNIKIDTHKDNYPMRKLLKKNGYIECGTIVYSDVGERIALQKVDG